MTDAIATYEERFRTFLPDLAKSLAELVMDHLDGMPRIDQIRARAKDPQRFADKAARTGPDGELKYLSPLTEIQDQIGVRIVVFYTSDVVPVLEMVRAYFQPIEEMELVPESPWQFGYFGKHLVLAMPRDVVPAGISIQDAPTFFELQIKTLFQHAWSESNHDLGYKSPVALTEDQQRRLAFSAAQAWGADRIFQELWVELTPQA